MKATPLASSLFLSVFEVIHWHPLSVSKNPWQCIFLHSGASLVLFLLLPHETFLVFWHVFTVLLSTWPQIIPSRNKKSSIAHGGPLGPGCSKILNVITGLTLWNLQHKSFLPISVWEQRPTMGLLAVCLGVTGTVNAVLFAWSRLFQTNGSHKGVQDLVQTSQGRHLSKGEHVQFMLLAMVNAACEEITYRGIWRSEFSRYLTTKKEMKWYSNGLQALPFGIAHYKGIPSGFVGVGLTFVYGILMGILCDLGHGLGLPILAHSLADYYIFASIARGRVRKKTA